MVTMKEGNITDEPYNRGDLWKIGFDIYLLKKFECHLRLNS